jgi:translation initiation factor 6 (eIF-6)
MVWLGLVGLVDIAVFDGTFSDRKLVGRRRLVILITTAGDGIHPQESRETTREEVHELSEVCRLEITVEDGTPNDDGDGVEHELSGDDLRRIEALQRPIDVPYLKQGGGDEDGK